MISFDEFLKQDECDKYNMLQECNAIIQQKENIIKEVREYIELGLANEEEAEELLESKLNYYCREDII